EVPFRSFGITLNYRFGKLDFKKNEDKDDRDNDNNNNTDSPATPAPQPAQSPATENKGGK
ncbi:MAG TPA: hypothetical protein VGM63_11230, partial [Mucilaginibacter sp.]